MESNDKRWGAIAENAFFWVPTSQVSLDYQRGLPSRMKCMGRVIKGGGRPSGTPVPNGLGLYRLPAP